MKRKLIAALLTLLPMMAAAQCSFRNTAFKSGEYLTYNLYFNWQFVWVKVGNASMSTVQSHYKGKDAYRASLITRSNKRADSYFIMRDTLLSYCTTQMEPLYFRKGAQEGKRYTVDEVFYQYPGSGVSLKQHRLKHNGEHIRKETHSAECVYDMLNIFLRARSFNPANWKKGYEVKFPMADGKNMLDAKLKFSGKTTVKADNGKKYRCLQLSYMEYEKGKWNEIVRFYVTDDDNHVPVRLDMFLRFGSAKAFLVSQKGLRNPVKSEVK